MLIKNYFILFFYCFILSVNSQPRSPSVMSNRSMSIPRGEPEVHIIQLHKSDQGMGLSIVATTVSVNFSVNFPALT